MPASLCTLPAPRVGHWDRLQPPTLAELHRHLEAQLPQLRLRDPERPVTLRLEVGGLRRRVTTDDDVKELFAQRPEALGPPTEVVKVEVSEDVRTLDRTWRPEPELQWCDPRCQIISSCGHSHHCRCVDFRSTTPVQQRGQRVLVLGPEWPIVGYKVVAKVGQQYYSIWAGHGTQYYLNITVRDQALPNRAGGLYISDTAWSAARQFIPPNPSLASAQRIVLRCACEGPFIERAGGKVQCSQLTPLEEVPVPEDDPSNAPDDVWRRFYARGAREQPVRGTGEPVVPLDAMGRMDTMLFWDVVGYMVVRRDGSGYVGVWAGDTNTYELGISVCSEAQQNCRGGFWVSRAAQVAAAQLQRVAAKPGASGDLVVLRCACGGPFITYPGKTACSRVTPLGEVPAAYMSPLPGAEKVAAPDGQTVYTKWGDSTKLPPKARPGSAPLCRGPRRPSRPAPVRRRPCRGHPVARAA